MGEEYSSSESLDESHRDGERDARLDAARLDF